ncbi:MAG: SPFH domain-containing protein [Candidatus Paceibacterota bacterium]|jgi:hypothetical protein
MNTNIAPAGKPVPMFRTDKGWEIALLLSFCVALFLVTKFLLSFAFATFGMGMFQKEVALFAMAIWLLLLGRSLPYFLVSVPEVTSLITVNLFGGELKEYQTGIHLRFPWEQVKPGNYINLRIFAKDFEKGETYPALDGVMLHVVWGFQYRGMRGNIGKYIAVDKTVIDGGLHDIGSSFLAQIFANLTAETARKNIKRIENCVKGHYEYEIQLELQEPTESNTNGVAPLANVSDKEIWKKRESLVIKAIDEYLDKIKELNEKKEALREEGRSTAPASYEEAYGIDLILVAISDIDYDPKFQEALATREIAKKVKETAEVLQKKSSGGGEAISDKEAMEAAMVLGKAVTKTVHHNVQEIKGEGMEAVINFVSGLFAKTPNSGKPEGKGKP